MSEHNSEHTVIIKKLLSCILVGKYGLSEELLERAFLDLNFAQDLLQQVLSQERPLLINGEDECRWGTKKTIAVSDALILVSRVRQPLGKLLLTSGMITQEQLEQALELQQQTGERIGEVFVRLGILDAPVRDDALRTQQQQQKTGPVPAAIKIGEILVASGHLTQEQLQQSLQLQKNSDKKLGEILVERGYVKQKHVDQGIHLQHMLVTAAISTIVSLSSIKDVEAASSSNVSTASLHISVVIKPAARLKVLYQQGQLEITSEHIDQGYIEIAGASSIEVRNNSPSGYLLNVENLGGPFRDVLVNGLGNEIQLHGNNAWVLMPYTPIPKTLNLSFRVMLSRDTRPGSYPWPFQLNAAVL
jgi:hypothetical protein